MWTKKGKYGLKALVYLAGIPKGTSALAADIARFNNIPHKFLEAILLELRNAAFVSSKKGKGGGYRLARPSANITVGDVVRLFEGPLAPFPCASRTQYRPCDDCTDEDTCAVRLAMVEVRRAISDVLDRMTLEEMRSRVSASDAPLMFHI